MKKQQQPQTPSFLKLYTGECDEKIKIPDSFMAQHGENLSGKLVLMSTYGDPVVVSVERSSVGGRQWFFFKHGWSNFVEENGVEEHDSLVFHFTGDRTANVVVYDSSGCVKGLKVKKQQAGSLTKKRFRNGDDDEETEHASVPRKAKRVKRVKREAPKLKKAKKSGGLANKSASFQVEYYKKYMQTSLYIPMEFHDATELSQGDKVQLEDPSGEVWSVSVIAGDRRGRQLRLAGGWPDFVAANRLAIGDGLEFCFKAEGLKQVKIDRKKKKKVIASDVKKEEEQGVVCIGRGLTD